MSAEFTPLLVLLLLCGLSLLAQQPGRPIRLRHQPATLHPAADPKRPARRPQRPLTPVEQREQQIRQFDPLDRGDDPNAHDKDAKEKSCPRCQSRTAPTRIRLRSGSIAATEQRSAPRRRSAGCRRTTTE